MKVSTIFIKNARINANTKQRSHSHAEYAYLMLLPLRGAIFAAAIEIVERSVVRACRTVSFNFAQHRPMSGASYNSVRRCVSEPLELLHFTFFRSVRDQVKPYYNT